MKKISKPSRPPVARASVAGAAFGFLLILATMIFSSHNALAFFSLGGLMVVVGGVIAVAFMSYDSKDVNTALNAIKTMFHEQPEAQQNLSRDMMTIIKWAHVIKDGGMRGLETNIAKSGIKDPFVIYGLNMVISGYTAEEIRSMMETSADSYYERDSIPAEILQSMASHAPAFGMVGTLVGMVAMLCNLSDNIASVGPSLAVAFLSTLYGVVTARMIYMPAASKLRQQIDNLRFRNHLITEGLVLLVCNKTPMFIQDRLNSFLRPDAHNYFNPIKEQAHPPQLKAVRA